MSGGSLLTVLPKTHTYTHIQTNFMAALARRPDAKIVAVDMEQSHLDYIRRVHSMAFLRLLFLCSYVLFSNQDWINQPQSAAVIHRACAPPAAVASGQLQFKVSVSNIHPRLTHETISFRTPSTSTPPHPKTTTKTKARPAARRRRLSAPRLRLGGAARTSHTLPVGGGSSPDF